LGTDPGKEALDVCIVRFVRSWERYVSFSRAVVGRRGFTRLGTWQDLGPLYLAPSMSKAVFSYALPGVPGSCACVWKPTTFQLHIFLSQPILLPPAGLSLFWLPAQAEEHFIDTRVHMYLERRDERSGGGV